MTDFAWDLLRELADAANADDYQTLEKQASCYLKVLGEAHFEVVLDATVLTNDFVGAHRDFLQSIANEIEARQVKFDSFRPCIRLEVLRERLAA